MSKFGAGKSPRQIYLKTRKFVKPA